MANDDPHFKDLEGWHNDHTDWLKRDVSEFRQRHSDRRAESQSPFRRQMSLGAEWLAYGRRSAAGSASP